MPDSKEKAEPHETTSRPSETTGNRGGDDLPHNNGETKPTEHTQTTQRNKHHKAPIPPTSRRLYVGNLHPRVTAVHLERLLAARSLAAQNIVAKPGGGNFMFVTLPSLADAVRAQQLLHGRTLLGRRLVVQPAHTPQESSTQRAPRSQRQLDDQIKAIQQKLQGGSS